MNLQNPTPIIKRVEILGLHGDRNLIADFDASVKILVDENGSGKTTFLSILAGVLQGIPHVISWHYQFDQIHIYFSNGKIINCSGKDNRIRDSVNQFRQGMAEVHQVTNEKLANHLPQKQLVEHRMRQFTEYLSFQLKEANGQRMDMGKAFHYRILYLPTHRLVENDFHQIGYDPTVPDSYHQSNMIEVRTKWDTLTEEIRQSALQGFSETNGRMLDDFANGIRTEKINYTELQQFDALEVVLARSGDKFSSNKHAHILQLVESGRIQNDEYKPLAYLLANLIKIYEQQRTLDETIKRFAHVVNGYLIDKKVNYNQTELSIQIIDERTGKHIPLDKLSSGEKQIVTIFTKLYLDLEDTTPYAIFFDEPELSLAIEWQRKLLADIAQAERCAFLLAATHSPFIFENELAPYADVLKVEYLEEPGEPSN